MVKMVNGPKSDRILVKQVSVRGELKMPGEKVQLRASQVKRLLKSGAIQAEG